MSIIFKHLAARSFCLATLTATGVTHASWGPLTIADREVAPGTTSKFAFIPDRTFEASYLNTPVFVARGAEPGPTLCLTAGIHGDELNGVEIARRAFAAVDPTVLRGTLITLPAINAEGIRTGNRYLSDRRDLNRAFPGEMSGSVASLIANAVFERAIRLCDVLIDLHTASNQRTNLPQVRADLDNPKIFELAKHFGVGIIVGGKGPAGSLRREAARAGVTAIIYEAGEPSRFQEKEIARGVHGVINVMGYLRMIDAAIHEIEPTRVYKHTKWVRVARGEGGFFFPDTDLGDKVCTGDLLGHIIDPLTNKRYEVRAPFCGEVIGRALSRPVLSGYALYHLALQTEE